MFFTEAVNDFREQNTQDLCHSYLRPEVKSSRAADTTPGAEVSPRAPMGPRLSCVGILSTHHVFHLDSRWRTPKCWLRTTLSCGYLDVRAGWFIFIFSKRNTHTYNHIHTCTYVYICKLSGRYLRLDCSGTLWVKQKENRAGAPGGAPSADIGSGAPTGAP